MTFFDLQMLESIQLACFLIHKNETTHVNQVEWSLLFSLKKSKKLIFWIFTKS